MLSLLGEASLLASMFSISAVCLATAALFHIHVGKRSNGSIIAQQVNGAIADTCLFAAGALMLHCSCCCRVPGKAKPGVSYTDIILFAEEKKQYFVLGYGVARSLTVWHGHLFLRLTAVL